MENKKASDIIVSIEGPMLLFLFIGLFVGSLWQLALVGSVGLFIIGVGGIIYGLTGNNRLLPALLCVCGTDMILGLGVLSFKFIL